MLKPYKQLPAVYIAPLPADRVYAGGDVPLVPLSITMLGSFSPHSGRLLGELVGLPVLLPVAVPVADALTLPVEDAVALLVVVHDIVTRPLAVAVDEALLVTAAVPVKLPLPVIDAVWLAVIDGDAVALALEVILRVLAAELVDDAEEVGGLHMQRCVCICRVPRNICEVRMVRLRLPHFRDAILLCGSA